MAEALTRNVVSFSDFLDVIALTNAEELNYISRLQATVESRQDKHLKGLRALREEGLIANYCVVSLDPERRITHDGIVIYPWQDFLTAIPKVVG